MIASRSNTWQSSYNPHQTQITSGRKAMRLLTGLSALLLLFCAARLTLPAQAQDGQSLRYGETVQGSLSPSATEQGWLFSGNAGDWILVDMRAVGGGELDPFLTLLDPQSNTLASDDDGGEDTNARLGPLRLPTDGDYTIVAGRYNGAGAYLLTLHNLALLPALAPDKPLIGALSAEHPADFFALTVPEPGRQPLGLSVRSSDPTHLPILSVYGAEGVLASTEDSGGDALDPLPLAVGKVYAVVVAWSGQPGGETYELWLTDSRIPFLRPDEPVEALLETEAGTAYFFEGEGGTTARLTISATAGIAPALTVTAPGSDEILFRNEGSQTRILTVTLDLPATGLYRLDISDTSGRGLPGTVRLLLEILPQS